MHNTQLLKYIKGIINDDYAMDVLYYCIRRIVADNDFNLHDVTSIRISQKFHKEAVALNINHRFVSRLDALSLVLSVRALMLNHDYLDCCDDDRLLFNPYIEDRYRWLEYYTIINECVLKDEGFAHTFKLLHNVYIEKDISGEDEDEFESFTIMPERRNLRSYYEYKASHGIGGVSEDYISDNAFLCNNDLEEYKINKSIEYVGNTAFAYCPKLKILKIRGRNVIFGKFPIIECPSLESIIVPDRTSGYYTGILSYYQDIIIEESQTLSTFANSGHSTNESNDVVEDPIILEETTKESGSSKRNMLKRFSGFVKRNIKATILRGDVTIPQKTDDERMTLLKQTFEKKVTSYKYFWLLSLLYHIKENGLEQPISIEPMVKEIVVQAWMYVVEYNSEFTSSDQLPHIVNAINENNEPGTDMDEIRIVVNNDVSSYSDIRSMVVKLANNVPYRFLSPWITYSTALDVSKRSLKFENDCPYSVTKEEIRINPKWKTFFEKNTDSIQEYVKKELCNYLNIEYSDDNVDEESEWHFIDNVYFERASKFFLKHKCRVVMAEMGYYLEVNNEYIKLGDYQDGFDMWDGSIWIKRPTIVSKANRIVHVYGKKVHEIGWIKEFDTFITFTNPSCEEYTITFNS